MKHSDKKNPGESQPTNDHEAISNRSLAQRRVRLIDVAQEVGVSVQVVSKVLNGGTSNVGASEQTRHRVKEAAQRLGYRRHAAGMALRSQAFRSVGLLMGSAIEQNACNCLPQSILAGLTQATAEADYTISLMAAGQLIGDTVHQSRLLNEQMVDVLLIVQACEPSDDLMESIRYMPTPVLWMHRQIEQNAVAFDEQTAAETLVEHLAERGAQSIFYLNSTENPLKEMATNLRQQGFQSACERLRLEARALWDERVERLDRCDFFVDWLEGLNETRFIIVDDCAAALTLVDVALAKGIDIPQKLKIVSFDNGKLCTASSPMITVMLYPELELGRAAGEMAIELAQNPQQTLDSRILKYKLQIGETS